MSALLSRSKGRAGLVSGAIAVATAMAGCGGAHRSADPPAAPAAGTPAAFNTPAANPIAYPPISVTKLRSGPATQQVTEAIKAFYRAAWQDDAGRACARFSPTGVAGFMHAAETAFPQAVTSQSSCEHAMEIYNAALGDSATTAQENDPSFSTSAIDDVGVGGIKVSGSAATAIAPTNVVDLINPERFYLSRVNGLWLINGSSSLNKSSLPEVLAQAKAKGELTPKR